MVLRVSVILANVILMTTMGIAAPDKDTRDWWAFKPVASVAVPEFPSAGNPIDAFIGTRLAAERDLMPNPPASRRTLYRRLSIDLLGLPPDPDASDRFCSDPSPDAWFRALERMLASPRYGERWGRYWMDVARYADTAGDNADYPVPELHLFRDYIIDAFNADMPYDQFVEEQMAGDILAKQHLDERYASKVSATGFLALSRRYGTGPFELWHLTLENTLETVGQAFMALNLKCARCHDHKFDPLTDRDYYGLYGIFASTSFPWAGSEEVQSKKLNRQEFPALLPDAQAAGRWRAWEEKRTALREDIAALEKVEPRDSGRIEALNVELRTLEKPGAPTDLPVAYAVKEGQPRDEAIHQRGNPHDPGAVATRCPPAFLGGSEGFAIPDGASGRLALARWLTSPAHPLTARVMVNRIWHHHFGRGLVSTPNHFGRGSESPLHRELLDFLARRFVENGWSMKDLHRLILTSAAYQRSSDLNSENMNGDPENRLHWRFNRRRLDAEAIRDSLLQVGSSLNLSRPGAHPFPPPEHWSWTQHNPFKDRYESNHRSVYLMTQRFQRHPFLALFDGPDTNSSTGRRRSSTIPQQALYAMNHPFVDQQAALLGRRAIMVAEAKNSSDASAIAFLFRISWGRPPASDEIAKASSWLEAARQAQASEPDCWHSLARVMINANAFYYVD